MLFDGGDNTNKYLLFVLFFLHKRVRMKEEEEEEEEEDL